MGHSCMQYLARLEVLPTLPIIGNQRQSVGHSCMQYLARLEVLPMLPIIGR